MMGTSIVGAVLTAAAPVTSAVPVDRIKAGRLPDGVKLPALLLRTISVVERQPLKRSGWVRVTERVAVTVRAANYREQKAIIRSINAAGKGEHGNVAGAKRVSIRAAGIGPDVAGPADSFEQTQDFRVSFDAPEEAAGA